MITDCHTHIFSPAVRENADLYRVQDPVFRELYASSKARILTADELVRAMDAAGVDRAVVCALAWGTQALCVQHNDAIIDAVQRYPERLIGFFIVAPGEREAALREVERCVGAGLRGVGEARAGAGGWDLADRDGMKDILDALEAYRLPLLLHTDEPVGHLYPGKGNMTPDRLAAFLALRPALTVILAHFGGGLPFYALMPEVRAVFANVYVDSAAAPFVYTPEVYSHVAEAIGVDKVLFGSDYPLMPYKRAFNHLEAAGLTPEEREAVLGANAARLFDRALSAK